PAEVRITRCPSCLEYRLDPAQAAYDFMWPCAEGFHLDAIAPLSIEQLPCENCGGYNVEIIGTAHAFPLDDGHALHLVYWLDAGQMRARFLFQSDPEGFIGELRSFYTIDDARNSPLGAEN